MTYDEQSTGYDPELRSGMTGSVPMKVPTLSHARAIADLNERFEEFKRSTVAEVEGLKARVSELEEKVG